MARANGETLSLLTGHRINVLALICKVCCVNNFERVEHSNSDCLFLIVNIDPGENAFPSREQELDTETPDVADIFFWRAF